MRSDRLRCSAHARKFFFALSADSVNGLGRDAEADVPDLHEICGPDLPDFIEEVAVDEEQVQAILDVNSHAQQIAYFGTPMEIKSDVGKSAIFLAAAFFNHDCSPNMQRVVVQDMMFCRAARDVAEGEELNDSYCLLMTSLKNRRLGINGYGFQLDNERSRLEEAVLTGTDVVDILRGVEDAVRRGDDLEDASGRAETAVLTALDRAVQSGVVPMPATPVPLDRIAAMLEGFEKPKTAGEAAYLAAFGRTRNVVAAGLCPVFRAVALHLENDGKNLEASVFWKRVLELLEAVVPGSELAALTATKLVVNRLNAMRLDPAAVAEEIDDALARSHVAYGGGLAVFRHLHAHCFNPTVLERAEKSPSIAS